MVELWKNIESAVVIIFRLYVTQRRYRGENPKV